MKLKSKNKAIIFLITSAFFFALMSMFVRLSGDLPTFQKMLFRNAIAALIAFIILIKNKERLLPSKLSNIPFLLLRTFGGLLGVFCNFYAVDHLLLSDASILNKMSPFFAIIFSFIILREKPSFLQTLAVIGAFVGSLFVIKPSFLNAQLLPSIIGLLGGVCAGMAYACVRKLTTNGESSAYVVFFFSFVSRLCVLPLTAVSYTHLTLPTMAVV